VDNLEQAAEAMQPAAKHLSDIQLQQAIPSEQKALQHLLRAEALFTEIQVAFQQAGAGGGGSQAGRDLAEMFELEMDLEKNQYETESQVAKDASREQIDDAIRKLRELAQRQERLEREAANQRQAMREQQRWRQE
jgi:molybdenum-dependent DNA-binding transcriptional regulator ModE